MDRRIQLVVLLLCTAFYLLSPGTTASAFEFPPSIAADQVVKSRLKAAYYGKEADYEPRTHLKTDGEPKYINRLIEAVSPYLLQHAHNPVDWHVWSSELLEKAKTGDKPIFLSIGYATCHWCHVMERESFDQEDVAEVLNERFISIKIDREEHPDLDHLYLTATQLQQGRAGWPNTLWLTPDGKPFHTATYLTKGELIRTSMILSEGWRSPSARSEILAVANGLSGQIKQIIGDFQGTAVPLNEVVYSRAVDGLLKLHNAFEGGFSETSQFPQETYLLFLLDQWRRGGKDELLDVVTVTLDAIATGGIHDHVGGGFHRYAVDPGWRTPHFEKMLYNQALLSRVFLEAWEATGKTSYKRATKRALDYVHRDMAASNGAFFSAEDADSLNVDGQIEEGAFYTWQSEELLSALGGDKEAASELIWGSVIQGRDPLILHLDPEGEPDLKALDKNLEKLRQFRSSKTRPFKDKKIIAGWNGLMIRSLASAGVAFDDQTYIDAAKRSGEAVWKGLWADGQLARFMADGISNGRGLLEDYAWLGLGFVSLFDATGKAEWLERAKMLASSALAEFSTGNGLLKQASVDGPLGPVFGAADDAVPSAKSSMLELLGLLIHRTSDLQYFAHSEKISSGLSTFVARKPEDLSYALIAHRLPQEGESTHRQVRANGNVRLQLRSSKLILNISDGWHLSANKPGYDYLIGTKIEGAKVDWPTGQKTKLGFATQAAYVYKGQLEIPIESEAEMLTLIVQACSDKICLAPEKAAFRTKLP